MPYHTCPKCKIEICYCVGEKPRHKCKALHPPVEPHFLDSPIEKKKTVKKPEPDNAGK